MKTRKILAASTAALLCSATVAVVSASVASAATAVTEVAVDHTGSNLTTSATVASDTGSLTVKVKGLSSFKQSASPDALDEIQEELNEGVLTLSVDTSSDGAKTCSYHISESDGDGGFQWKEITVTVTVTKETASSSESSTTSSESSTTSSESSTTSSESNSEITGGGSDTSSAVDVEYDSDGDWTAAGDISFKISKANKDKFKGVTIVGSEVDASSVISATAGSAVKTLLEADEMKDKLANQIAAAIYGDGTNATAAIFNITVSPEADEEYTNRTEFKLTAPIQINVEELTFEANHVYHVEDNKLVEVKVDKLTKKNDKFGIQFSSKNFSPFIITKDVIKAAVNLDDAENPANADESGAEGGNNANTGIALAIAPVVLAAGAVAVVALKKKH